MINMKLFQFALVFVLAVSGYNVSAQTKVMNTRSERYGTTLNLGLGLGYYGYVGGSIPVIHADLEFDVAKHFTLAPFLNVFTYENYYYWGNSKNPYRDYHYRETAIPIGIKGSYYFDQFLGANSNWDFYLAGSLGFIVRRTTWENGYYGDKVVKRGTGALYLDLHIGTEYHISKKVGLFLDLSTGVSTLGLGIHF